MKVALCLPVLVALLLPAAAPLADDPPPANELSIAAVGDVNLGSAFPSEEYLPPDQGRGLLEPARELLNGDIVFGNLEGPLADEGSTEKCGPKSRGCFAFRTPTVFVERLKEAGFNVFSLANNHAMDFGEAGRLSTMRTLDQAGISHSGPPGDIAVLQAAGRQVALVAFAPYDHSGDLRDIAAAAKTVAELCQRFPLVVVSFHGGSEGAATAHTPYGPESLGDEPRGDVRRFARAMVDAGAALVLGHGPHVLRGLEVYRGRLIAYSLGNFCTFGRFSLSGPLGIAAVLQVRLDASSGRFLGGRLRGTLQPPEGGARPDAENRALALVRDLGRQDFPLTAPAILDDGSLQPLPGDGEGLLLSSSEDEVKKLAGLIDELVGQGLERERVLRAFGDRRAALLDEVMDKFSHPAEHMSYKKYRRIFMVPDVLEAGGRWLEEQKPLLDEIEKKFGIGRHLLGGLVAVESRFGTRTGAYPVFNALATVALRLPRRSEWGKKELANLLRLYQDDPLAVLGSYAGAVGLVQFMPSSILAYGVDQDKDGRIDLSGWPDALASAANYLRRHGYRGDGRARPGSAAYRALRSYNPSRNYIRAVVEVAEALAANERKQQEQQPTQPAEAAGAPTGQR